GQGELRGEREGGPDGEDAVAHAVREEVAEARAGEREQRRPEEHELGREERGAHLARRDVLREQHGGAGRAEEQVVSPHAFLSYQPTKRSNMLPRGMRGERLWACLREEVDAASLAVFRIAFGAILLCEVIRYFTNGWIEAFYVAPRVLFSYVPGLLRWGGRGMFLHFGALGVLAAMIS